MCPLVRARAAPGKQAMIRALFATQLYQADLADHALNAALATSCRVLARDDAAGQAWSKAHGYKGYTSYASLDDLPTRDPNFAALKKALDPHARAFTKALHLDLRGRKLKLDSIWANVMEPGGAHAAHIHPHSVLSGTYYVDVPPNASALRLEDPRLPLMMAAPPRLEDAPEDARTFISITPRAGEVLMWESFLRHDVPPNAAKKPRISVSFNYGW